MMLYLKSSQRAMLSEEGERLKLLRVAVWGEDDAFSNALNKMIKD